MKLSKIDFCNDSKYSIALPRFHSYLKWGKIMEMIIILETSCVLEICLFIHCNSRIVVEFKKFFPKFVETLNFPSSITKQCDTL